MGIQKHRRPTIAPNESGVLTDVVGGAGGNDISTDEQDTGRKDSNGDAIYVKTVRIAAVAIGTQTVAHGITGLKRLVTLQGSVKNFAGTTFYPLPMASGGANISMQIGVDATNVEFTPGNFWGTNSLKDAEFIMEYTKS